MKSKYLLLAAILLFIGCESREKRFEREARENQAIMQKITDSIKAASESLVRSQNDTLLSTSISAYAKIAYAYHIEKGKFTCNKDVIGFVLEYSHLFPVSFSCYDNNGTASFSVIGDLGACSGSTIDVKPIINGDEVKYEYAFNVEKCKTAVLPIIQSLWVDQ